MFHISQRTGQIVRVVRVFSVPSLLKLQPLCSANSRKRSTGWPSARGRSQNQNRKPVPLTRDARARAR